MGAKAKRSDPRHYQITCLVLLLGFGIIELGFSVSWTAVAATVLAALATQGLCGRLVTQKVSFDFRSPLISALSICILLRTMHEGTMAIAAVLAIASKYLIRYDGRHVFNPATFGIIMVNIVPASAWISPGQWGHLVQGAFFLAGLGSLVAYRAERSDTCLSFLLSYAMFVLARAYWIGDPWAIALHQLQSGSLLLFSFFMISDPKTSPDARPARVIYAVSVALVAMLIRFWAYQPNELLWSLFLCAPLTPFFNKLWPQAPYQWHRPVAPNDIGSLDPSVQR